MNLFVLKCDSGYIKKTPDGCQCISIEQATVFNQSNIGEAEYLARCADDNGLKNIRLAELSIIEKDYVRKF